MCFMAPKCCGISASYKNIVAAYAARCFCGDEGN